MNPQGGTNTALIDEVSLTPSQDEIIDGGFESPVLAANSYQVAPSGTPWQFSGLAGMSTNGSGVTSGCANAPQGNQVGFIMNKGTMSYSVYLDADTYNLSFLAAQRANHQTQSQEIQVLVDTKQVGLITPSDTSYCLYETSNFTVAAGMHTIQFLGMSPASGESTALIDQVAIVAAEDPFIDGSFEVPALTAKTYEVAPSGSAWQFSGIAGVSTNNSAFTLGNRNAPDGTQIAFLKDNGSISQSLYFAAGSYNISFQAAQRLDYQTRNQQIEVLVDGKQVGSITPTSTSYLLYQTSNFAIAAGTHTVEFLGMSPATADSTAFIDDMAINAGCAINDGSFEEPLLAAKTYQVAPSGTPWQFAGDAGVSANASAFTFGNPVAPDGNQVAFIKNSGSISQSVCLAAGVYNITFMAAQRYYYQTQYQSIEVLVDGNDVGTVTPDAPASNGGKYPTGTTFGLYDTTNFTITPEMAESNTTIEFLGLNPTKGNDNTAFIDDVQLNP